MKTFNEVTPAVWRAKTALQRSEFYRYWNKRGEASFGCSRCGYPTGECAASCVACEHNPEVRYNAQFISPQFREALVALELEGRVEIRMGDVNQIDFELL